MQWKPTMSRKLPIQGKTSVITSSLGIALRRYDRYSLSELSSGYEDISDARTCGYRVIFSDKSPFRAFLGCLLTSPQPRLKSFTAGLLQVAGFGIPTKPGGFIVSL